LGEYLDQFSVYVEMAPLWPFVLLAVLGLVALGVDVVNRRRRLDAIDNFCYTIETEFSGMYPKPVNWPENVNTYLCERLPEMQENFTTLRNFIPQKKLRIYNEDWNKFRDFCLEITDEKCVAGAASDSDSDPKEVFHTLVFNLLKYTKKL
jgi:hypothetical protein